MKKMTQKEIKRLVKFGHATNITYKKEYIKGLKIIGVSAGTDGRNGLLLEDKQGKLYAITKRASSVLMY